jgi:hypothetical protein
MRRRDFITLLGGTAAAWPLAARAQQGERMRRIGVLLPFSEGDPLSRARVVALREGLQNAGWSDGRNARFDFRWTSTDPDQIKDDAANLADLRPDVIVTGSNLYSRAKMRDSFQSGRRSGASFERRPGAMESSLSLACTSDHDCEPANPRYPDHVRSSQRSARIRLGQQHGASGRQRHRFRPV